MSIIPESHRYLFDLPAVWHVATIGPSGEPHWGSNRLKGTNKGRNPRTRKGPAPKDRP